MEKDSHEWRTFFDSHAPDYMSNEFTRNTLAEIDFVIEHLKPPARGAILDVGCGTGRHSIELARRGYRVTGIDLSSGMLKQAGEVAARERVSVRFEQADAADFELDSEFDAAICLCEGAFGLLSSLDDPAEHDLAILRNISRALKQEGGLILTVLNGFRLVRMYQNDDVVSGRLDPLFMLERYEALQGKESLVVTERGFAPSELRLMLRMTGFEVLHLGGGTAGNWGIRTLDLDEYELMASCRKSS